MSWHYRSPSTFPAIFARTLKAAALQPGEPQIFYADRSLDDVQTIAERFRWFKWCVKQDPSVAPDIAAILDTYEVRTRVRPNGISHILYLTVSGAKMSEFERLNPELARAISSE